MPASESNTSTTPRLTSAGMVPVALALLAMAVVLAPLAYGPISLPGLAAIGLLAVLIALGVLWRWPSALVILTLASVPIKNVGYFFPFEMVFGLLFVLVVLQGIRRRADWLLRVEPLELLLALFTTWAFLSGFWSQDGIRYVLGVRRLGMGILALWTAARLVHFVPRWVFVMGMVLCAGTISLATVLKRVSTGFSNEQALIARTAATDLGWGWANYIAAILLILMPFVVVGLLSTRSKWLRAAAIPVAPMLMAVQIIAVARGALLLFVAGLFAQLIAGLRGRRLLALLSGLAVVAAVVFGPWGEGILGRFTSLRELSSGTIRLWYFREGWLRTLDNLPWGIGLQQGYSYPDKLHGLDPHNYWLDLSSELGYVGPLLWLIVLIAVLRTLRRITRNPELRREGIALQVMFWISQIHSLIEPTFQGVHYTFLFFWMIGGYVGYERALRAAPATSPPASAAP